MVWAAVVTKGNRRLVKRFADREIEDENSEGQRQSSQRDSAHCKRERVTISERMRKSDSRSVSA